MYVDAKTYESIAVRDVQIILRQRFEAIKYGDKSIADWANQDIQNMYEYFVYESSRMSHNDFEYSLACAEIAARR